MTEWAIDHRRMDIISKLNRGSNEFEELKEEVFYYDDKLECWLSRKRDYPFDKQSAKQEKK